ncbi:helix-turn-helix domain-containing protein [Alsobacter sp. R-9]
MDTIDPGRQLQPLAYTIDEASQLLRISRAKLYLEMRAGKLRSVRFGRSRRLAPADLADYVARHREST